MTTLPIDNTMEDPAHRAPLVLNHEGFTSVTEEICHVNEAPRPPLAWYVTLVISGAFASLLGFLIMYLVATEIGRAHV